MISTRVQGTATKTWYKYTTVADVYFTTSVWSGSGYSKFVFTLFSGIKPKIVILYISTFSLVTVLGAGIGIGLSETMQSDTTMQSPLVTILQGLASGTLLYVAFFGVLEKERQSGTNPIFQVWFALLLLKPRL